MQPDKLQSILFADQTSQNALVQAIKSKGYAATNFQQAYDNLLHKVDDQDFQLILAPLLRARTIEHLRQGASEYTKAVHREYNLAFAGLDTVEEGDAPDLKNFLINQSQAYVYASDIEAGALAELLDVTFSCQQEDPQTHQPIGTPYIYYRAPEEHAEIVHLNNIANHHFFVIAQQPMSTIGDGNCLYNGFAQVIRQLILHKEAQIEHISLYIEQEIIYEQIKNIEPTPINEIIKKILARTYSEEDRKALAVATADFVHPNELPKASENNVRIDLLFAQHINVLREKTAEFYMNKQVVEAVFTSHLYRKLKEKAELFFALNEQERKTAFPHFKNECIEELEQAKVWAKQHRGYTQIFINILQTLTVIGAVLGVMQWSRTGHYSLFSAPTKTLQLIEQAQNEFNHYDLNQYAP